MATPTFYHPALHLGDSLIVLGAEESAHAIRSRRLRVDDTIALINGTGLSALAQVNAINKKQLCAEITEIRQHPPPQPAIHVASAIPKGDRQRTMVDMLTQSGVAAVTPLHCEYSVTRFTDKMQGKWQRAAIEACKQSGNPWLPDIRAALKLNDLLREIAVQGGTALFADQSGTALSELGFDDGVILVLVGPEGGFSDTEQSALKAAGVIPVRLGKHILRSETAAVTAAALLSN